MTKKLYVGNLAWGTTTDTLRQAFAEGGRAVADVYIAMDRETNRPRGFAFVEMGSPAEAEAAIAALDGRSIDGRNIRVSLAQERARPGGPGGGQGGGPRGPRPGGPAGPPRGFAGGGPPRGDRGAPAGGDRGPDRSGPPRSGGRSGGRGEWSERGEKPGRGEWGEKPPRGDRGEKPPRGGGKRGAWGDDDDSL
jgi:cold-inducible RNA-binding protein